MPLTNAALRNAKPTSKPFRMFDAGGLYVEVAPSGGRWWRWKYRFDGKEKRLSFGVYPEVPLAGRRDAASGQWIEGARDKRDHARKLLSEGIDPGAHRKAQREMRADRAANSLEFVAREWFVKFGPRWVPTHADKIIRRFERDVFPWIGSRGIADVTASELLTVLRRIEERGAIETAHRALQNCGQVFRYAVATGRAERDPSAELRGALAPVKERHHAAITEPKAVGALLRAIADYRGSFTTKCALRLAPMLFVRPGELRHAEWGELDLECAEWNIPGERMKMREPHLVPLPRQAVEVLRELRTVTGTGRYVFPGGRSVKRPMSENAILAALRRMGFANDEMTGHGFRAMARTMLDEVLKVRPHYIEHQLAHAVRDPNGRAYNRTAHLAERRAMMQQWADYLESLAVGATVLPFDQAHAA